MCQNNRLKKTSSLGLPDFYFIPNEYLKKRSFCAIIYSAMKQQGLDQKLIEKIIKKAEEYLRMPNPLTVDASFGKAATIFLGDNHGAWGEYKKKSIGIYLNRTKEKNELKHHDLLRGMQEAAWARRDAEVEEAEENEEVLSQLKGREGKII
ncbi:MAG: hypothetical protein G01um101413_469 [Parcubacteria group bacterium Gr01-1014_13]|nr:MAG: hypothetical protein G01um101413_469 [Parcubacteria group bacterium Gr01-1014_13]